MLLIHPKHRCRIEVTTHCKTLSFVQIANYNYLKDHSLSKNRKKMFYENPTGAEELLAIAVIILAVGAATEPACCAKIAW